MAKASWGPLGSLQVPPRPLLGTVLDVVKEQIPAGRHTDAADYFKVYVRIDDNQGGQRAFFMSYKSFLLNPAWRPLSDSPRRS